MQAGASFVEATGSLSLCVPVSSVETPGKEGQESWGMGVSGACLPPRSRPAAGSPRARALAFLECRRSPGTQRSRSSGRTRGLRWPLRPSRAAGCRGRGMGGSPGAVVSAQLLWGTTGKSVNPHHPALCPDPLNQHLWAVQATGHVEKLPDGSKVRGRPSHCLAHGSFGFRQTRDTCNKLPGEGHNGWTLGQEDWPPRALPVGREMVQPP